MDWRHFKNVERVSQWVASVGTAIVVCIALVCWMVGRQGPPVQLDGPPNPGHIATPGEAVPDSAIVVGPGEDAPNFRGWSPQSRDDLKEWTARQAAFQLISRSTGEPVSQDNSKSNIRLWELKRLVVSDPPPNGPQLTGDCSSWSFAHAVESTQSGQVFGRGGTWKRIFPPWQYGMGRFVWRRERMGPLGSEGCSVAAVAMSAQEFGVISWDDAKAAGYEYSGQLADQWGNGTPPTKLKELAAQHKIGNIAPLRTAAELRDAVCNGYGTAFGSDFTGGNFRQVDGRIVCDNITPRLGKYSNQIWHHALCCDGYDGSAANGPWYHIQNSWYPTSHPAPIDGSPACGFWVAESTIEYIVAQDDAFAFSDFEGFVDQRDELDLFKVGAQLAPRNRGLMPPAQEVSFRKTTVSP